MFLKKSREVIALQTQGEVALNEFRAMMTENRKAFMELERSRKDHDTVLHVTNRYQEICRLLRKQNKEIVEENQRMSECEKLRMEEISVRFLQTVEDITEKLKEQEILYDNQLKESQELEEKVEQFGQHEKLRSEHFDAQLRAKALELQLEVAKCDQKRHILAQERERGDAYRAQEAQLLETEKEMKGQLAMYAAKFEHFQDALSRSNVMFAQFKEKMEDMDSTITRLKSENEVLKKTCAGYDVALLEQMNEKHSVFGWYDW